MQFEKGQLYHIYNRSNSGRIVFIKEENYIYFLWKIRKLLQNHCDVVAYCLMPTHFHLMIYVKEKEIHLDQNSGLYSSGTRTLNQSIGIILRSYSVALQKQENFTGSLFQQHTKAICLTKPVDVSPAYFNTAFGTHINILPTEKQYPQMCFNYIHNNPVAANIVSLPEEWEFSSARDYSGLRNGTLVNKNLAEDFGLSYR